MAVIKNDPPITNDPRYHDTQRLLKVYRDAVWSLEVSVAKIKKDFQIEYGSTIEEFLDTAYQAGADLSGTDIESHARSINRSNKMITMLRNAVDIMRLRHKNGEEYYWILYYTYLSPQEHNDAQEIVDLLRPHIRFISLRTYFRRKQNAVEALSSILWGYTARENEDILNEYFESIDL